MRRAPFLALILLAASSVSAASGAAPDARGVEFFETKIRPVLVQHCYACHSAEAVPNKKLRGGLFLDTRDGVRAGGDSGPAVVPGDVRKSLLLQALRHDGDLKMPPKGKLEAAVLADFTRWVEMGAPDPRDGEATTAKAIDLDAGRKFWSFRPLNAGTPPRVRNTPWARTPVDRFILAKLEAKGLTPSAPLERERLLRRVHFDLLGLPPAPADVEAFVRDQAPDAYERLVDTLLQSERFGERWARHWLDVVRYAESGGYEFDRDRPAAYHYRDFVIRALNQDMPYDQLVRWQVAGDHLVPGDYLATAATGFLVAGPYPGQTTAKTLQLIRYNHLDDMLSTLGTAMLGLSLGCARCHEHKYDPIPQEDYYRLLANLARTDSTDAKIDLNPDATRKARAAYDAAHAPLVAARDRFEKEQLPGRVRRWYERARATPAAKWLVLDAVSATGKATLKKQADGSLVATGKAERGDVYTVVAHSYQKNLTALKLDALPDASLPQSGPGRGADGGFVLTEVSATAAPLNGKGRPTPVALKAVRATFERPGFPLSGTRDADKKTGWSVGAAGKPHSALFEVAGNVGFDGGTVLTVTLKFEGEGAATLGRFRLSATTAPRPATLGGDSGPQNAVELRALLRADEGKLTPKSRAGVLHWFRTLDAEAEKIHAAVEEHAKQEPQPKTVTVFAATSGRGGDVRFLTRGEVDKPQGVARPGFVQVLTAGPEGRWPVTPSPRVGLAEWLTDTKEGAGHLLARVIVNRLWQHHMGRGLVGTPNDFGAQGEAPTHPELLDYLASELIRGGWKLKPVHRLILTSAVYRQGCEADPAALRADPQNRLWWRRQPRRLEAEAVRDALLAVSGTLDTTPYGPGTLDANSPRRSIYLRVKRSQMVPLMSLFDAPEPIQSVGARTTTTVPTQSLALMNSPLVRQRAEKLAQRVRGPSGTPLAHAVEQAYLTALGRRPAEDERERGTAFVEEQARSYAPGPRAADLALADFCQVLLCLNEFVYVD